MDYLSATQAAERLGVSRMRVNQLVNDGKLPARKIGNMWAIDAADFEKFAASREIGH